MLFSDLKGRVRALCDDQDATYLTDAFLAPLVNQSYEEVYNRLLATGATFERKQVELPAVAQNTADLSVFQAATQPLEFLMEPLSLEWKLAGQLPTNYRPARLVDKLSDVVPDQFISDWEWRAGVIYLTPASTAVDLRIRGDFIFAPLLADSDAVGVIKNLGVALGYQTAALVGMVRGNAGWAEGYDKKAADALDDVAQYLTRKDQAKVRRIGRMSRARRIGSPSFQVNH